MATHTNFFILGRLKHIKSQKNKKFRPNLRALWLKYFLHEETPRKFWIKVTYTFIYLDNQYVIMHLMH